MNASRVTARLTIPLKPNQADLALRAQQALLNNNGWDLFIAIKDQFSTDLVPFIECWTELD